MDATIIVALIAAGGSVIVILIKKFVKDRSTSAAAQKVAALNQVRGGIDRPASHQAVGRTINCSGWARDLAAGQHLWLAVEANGFIWFKEDEVMVDGNNRWEAVVFEDGATEEFALSLLVVNDTAHQQIADWFQTGIGTGAYPELQRMAGTHRIARIDGLRLRQQP